MIRGDSKRRGETRYYSDWQGETLIDRKSREDTEREIRTDKVR